MRQSILRLLLVAVLAVCVVAWSKEDHEIFRLRDEVEAAEGPNVTFYGFLGIGPGANQDEISKAYRKKSKLLHPDKVKRAFVANRSKPQKSKKGAKPGVHVSKGPSDREVEKALKEAGERFARLGIVAQILRGPGRERYDHFLKNGFPRWRGTGYYYSRFRPGLGSVLIGLFLAFGGAAHYGALVLGWKRQRDFMDRYIRHARRAAWGDELGVRGIPGVDSLGATPPAPPTENGEGAMPMNRRQKRIMERENRKPKKRGDTPSRSSGTATPVEGLPSSGERKRVIAENGKVLIVDSIGNVFLEEENEDGEKQEFLLDIDEIHRPTIRDTMLFRLPVWGFNKMAGRVTGASAPEQEVNEAEDEMASEVIVDERSASASSRGGSRKRGRRNN